MSVTNGSEDTVGSRRDKSGILAGGEGTIFWQPGSLETWLNQEVHGRSKEFKAKKIQEWIIQGIV